MTLDSIYIPQGYMTMKIKKNNIKVILSKDYKCSFGKNYFC